MFDLDEKTLADAATGFQIPAKPEILTQVQDLTQQSEPDLMALANLVATDPGLSAAILKVINSPFYGMSRVISEIKQAVMILGIDAVAGIVTALVLKQSFQGNSSIPLDSFWDEALEVANAMTLVGNNVKEDVPVDMLFTIGLFANCGVPLLAIKYQDYKEILDRADDMHENSIRLEEQHYKTNHAVLGYYLANSWHLPKELCQIILRHHDLSMLDQQSGDQPELIFAVLKCAENIVQRHKYRKTHPDWTHVGLKALTTLGITEEDFADAEEDYADLML